MAENIVQGIRDAISDLLVPELKAMKQRLEYQQDEQKGICEEIRELRTDMITRFERIEDRFQRVDEHFQRVDERFEQIHRDMNERFQKVDERFEQMHRDMNERFQKVDERFSRMYEELSDIKSTQREILIKLDVDKRLRRLEILFDEQESQKYRHAVAS